MEETPTGIPISTDAGTFELTRVEMFPETTKLTDARRICKFFEFLAAKRITFAAIDAHNQIVNLSAELAAFLNIDWGQVSKEERELAALAANRGNSGANKPPVEGEFAGAPEDQCFTPRNTRR